MLFIVAWIISPIVLIPLAIWAIIKKNKLSDFITALLRTGRIGADEYAALRVNPVRCGYTAPYNPPAYAYAPIQPPIPAMANPSNPTKAKKKPFLTSTNALLIIGVIFVIFAGIIFSTAAWLYMNDLERTGIVALASLFFFGVSLLAHRRLSLENTGAAFFMLGEVFAAITVVTAGYFKLMGNSFSVDGESSKLLFSFAFAIAAAFSGYGVKLYKKKTFVHFSLYSGLAALTLACGQFCDKFDQLMLVMNIFTAALIFLLYLGKLSFGELFDRPVKIFAAVSSSAFAVISLGTLFHFSRLNVIAYILTVLFIAQAAFYGISKKNGVLTALACVLSVILSVRISLDITRDDVHALVIFAVCMFALAAAFRFVKQLRTPFSDILSQTALLVPSLWLMCENSEKSCTFAAVILLLQTAFLTFYALENGRAHLIFARISAPMTFMLAACSASIRFGSKFECAAICAVLLSFAALILSFNSPIGKRFEHMHYSAAFFAGLSLFTALCVSETSAEYIIICVICAALFAVCMTAKNNILCFIPTVTLFPAAIGVAYAIYYGSNTEAAARAEMIFVTAVFAVLCAVSRTVFREKVLTSSKGSFRIDAAAVTAVLAPFILLTDSGSEYWRFLAVIELALYALNFCRRGNKKTANLTFITVASAFISIAVFVQPFIRIEDEILRHKYNLIPLLMFAFSLKYIWRGRSRSAEELGFAVNLFAFMCLIWDAIYFDDIFNTLCVLSIALVLLLRSFAMKKKRWFLISIAALVGVTAYAMRDYFSMINWWVYLLLVGILLITIAAANEYFKSRGETVKSKAGKLFEEWKNWD